MENLKLDYYHFCSVMFDYQQDKINLKTLYELLTSYNNLSWNKEEILFISQYLTGDKTSDERRMIIITILWSLPGSIIQRMTVEDPFIKFLIESVYDQVFYDMPIEIFSISDQQLIFKKQDLFFIINGENTDIEMQVPEEIKYTNCFCINCNTEEYLEESLLVPSLSFYLFEKENL